MQTCEVIVKRHKTNFLLPKQVKINGQEIECYSATVVIEPDSTVTASIKIDVTDLKVIDE